VPKFFFNVMLNGKRTADTAGMELPDIESARSKALEAAKEVLAARQDRTELTGFFLISDASGKPILTVTFDEALASLNRDRPRNGAM
jgi:hypothetical protein